MAVQYKKLIGLVTTVAVLLMPRFALAQTSAEVPVSRNRTVTVVNYEQPMLRIDVSNDPSDYYAQITITDSTLLFSKPDERDEFEKKRPKLERDYEKSRSSKTAGKRPYLQKYLDGRNLLRPGIEVSITFLEYPYTSRLVMQNLTILTDQPDDGQLSGPFEQVREQGREQVGYINGQRILLKPKVELVGIKGYAGRKFLAFDSLPEGVELAVQGKRQANGVLLVESATVAPDELALDQQTITKWLKTTRQLSADSTRVTFGSRTYRLLNDKMLTGYFTGLAIKLLPSQFRDLPTGHPASLNARVYVVQDSTANACAYPDGSVYLHTGLLTLIENEAQLAAVLSREWAHVAFHHPRLARQAASSSTISGTALSPTIVAAYGLEPAELAAYVTAFGGGPLSSNYKPAFESQADRLGIKYMLKAGYDPREMTRLWGKLSQKSPDLPLVPFESRTPNKGTRPFESPYGTHVLAVRRQQYDSSLVKSDYQNIDLNKFRTGGPSYRPIREHLVRLLTPPPPVVPVLPQEVPTSVSTTKHKRKPPSKLKGSPPSNVRPPPIKSRP